MQIAEHPLTVRVTPRAARDEITGFEGDVLRVRLRAPPVEGQANDSLRRLLAGVLRVRLDEVALVSGARSRTKRLRIVGLEAAEVRERLG
jgi:uncharacterized protein (TIGR00251 family)